MIRKILSLWFLLISLGYAGILLSINHEYIHLAIPALGQFRVLSGVAMVCSYLFAVTLVCIFFTTAFLRQSLEIRSLKRRLKAIQASETSLAGDINHEIIL